MKKLKLLLVALLVVVVCGLVGCDKISSAISGIMPTPTIEISEDGYWVINGEKTETKAVGTDGKNGTNGRDGQNGANGQDGQDGQDGHDVVSIELNENNEIVITFTDGSTLTLAPIMAHEHHEIVLKEVIVTEPTCTTTGTSNLVCETCNIVVGTATVDKLSHDCEDVVTAPTCTEQGYTTHRCKNCDYVLVDTYVDPLGHSYETEDYMFDSNQHWFATTCGHTDAVVKENHSYGEDGICTVCRYDSNSLQSFVFAKIDGKEEYKVIDFTANNVAKLAIPSEYKGLPVTAIGDAVFYGNKTITTVMIPGSVTTIGAALFCNCSSLQSVTLSKNLTAISDKAFYGCSKLTSIVLPDSVVSIGSEAFRGCSGLASVTMGDKLTSIGEYAFFYCSSLADIAIPESVTSIGGNAFYGCPCVVTNKAVSYVGNWLVACDQSITSVVVDSKTVGIASSAFSGCSSLTTINFDGTKEQWQAISKGDNWGYGVPSTCVVKCTDGTIGIND